MKTVSLISLDAIGLEISNFYRVSFDLLRANGKYKPVQFARLVFCHIATRLGHSQADIGNWLGKDAATAFSGDRRIREMVVGGDWELAGQVSDVLRRLEI